MYVYRGGKLYGGGWGGQGGYLFALAIGLGANETIAGI